MTAVQVVENTQGVPIVALEQPLPADDRAGVRELRNRTDIPVIADEAIVSVADLGMGSTDSLMPSTSSCPSVAASIRLTNWRPRRGAAGWT